MRKYCVTYVLMLLAAFAFADQSANSEFQKLLHVRDQFKMALADLKSDADLASVLHLYESRMAGALSRPVPIALSVQENFKDDILKVVAARVTKVYLSEPDSEFYCTLELSIIASTDIRKETRLALDDLGIQVQTDTGSAVIHHVYLFAADNTICYVGDYSGLEPGVLPRGTAGRITLLSVPILDILDAETFTGY